MVCWLSSSLPGYSTLPSKPEERGHGDTEQVGGLSLFLSPFPYQTPLVKNRESAYLCRVAEELHRRLWGPSNGAHMDSSVIRGTRKDPFRRP